MRRRKRRHLDRVPPSSGGLIGAFIACGCLAVFLATMHYLPRFVNAPRCEIDHSPYPDYADVPYFPESERHTLEPPPPGDEDAIYDFGFGRYQVVLEGFDEPSLWRNRLVQDPIVFRLTFVYDFQLPYTIRFEAHADNLYRVIRFNATETTPHREVLTSERKSFKLNREDGQALLATLHTEDFWSACSVLPEAAIRPEGGGSFVLEARKDGRYQIVHRSYLNESFARTARDRLARAARLWEVGIITP